MGNTIIAKITMHTKGISFRDYIKNVIFSTFYKELLEIKKTRLIITIF